MSDDLTVTFYATQLMAGLNRKQMTNLREKITSKLTVLDSVVLTEKEKADYPKIGLLQTVKNLKAKVPDYISIGDAKDIVLDQCGSL